MLTDTETRPAIEELESLCKQLKDYQMRDYAFDKMPLKQGKRLQWLAWRIERLIWRISGNITYKLGKKSMYYKLKTSCPTCRGKGISAPPPSDVEQSDG